MHTLTMKRFGQMGRFGNQLFQYAYLKGVSERTGATLQLPSWVGNHLFGLSDLSIRHNLAEFVERSQWSNEQVEPSADEKIINHDFKGYAQYHTCHFAKDRLKIQQWFNPTPEVESRLYAAKNKLAADIVGVHLRRGDYGRSIFPIIPVEWYKKHLKRIGAKRIFIATEDESLIEEFSDEWECLTAKSLGIDLVAEPLPNCTYLRYDLATKEPWAMDFYPDFYLLSHCDTLVGPNSSFSFFAAMLNIDLKQYWRASLQAADFEWVDPWYAYPTLREKVSDFRHLEGIALTSNPYW